MRFSRYLLFCFLLVGCTDSNREEKTELVMFCAAGIKAPVEEIAKRYEAQEGVEIQLQYGGSGTLLSNLQIAPGDIYLAADSSYTMEAKQKGLVTDTFPVAFMKAGIGVPVGNPKGIKTLNDLKRSDLRVGIGNPDAASIGKFTRKILSKHEVWNDLNPVLVTPTVNELANAVKLQSVDAVVIWNTVAEQYPDVDFISVPEFDAEKKKVTIAVATGSKNPDQALKFCKFLSSPDHGLPVFERYGFQR